MLIFKQVRNIPALSKGYPPPFLQPKDILGMLDAPSNQPPFLKMELMPSEVTPDSARRSASEHFPDVADAWALLLGGDGEGLKWSAADTLELVENFLDQAQQAGRKVLLATSRRTLLPVEEAIRQRAASHPCFLRGAWFHAPDTPPFPLLALIGACQRLIVTADSVSMTNEAVAAGVPTVTVYPRQGAPLARQRSNLEARP